MRTPSRLARLQDVSWLRSVEQQVVEKLRRDAYLLSTLKRSMHKAGGVEVVCGLACCFVPSFWLVWQELGGDWVVWRVGSIADSFLKFLNVDRFGDLLKRSSVLKLIYQHPNLASSLEAAVVGARKTSKGPGWGSSQDVEEQLQLAKRELEVGTDGTG